MRRRTPVTAMMLLVVAAQIALPLGTHAVHNLQEEAEEIPSPTPAVLGEGEQIQLYEFRFEAGAWIDQQAIPYAMLVHVFEGPFVFYIPEAAGGMLYFRGEQPVAVGTDPTGPEECTLPPPGDDLRNCMFTDDPVSNDSFTCTEDPPGEQSYQCTVSNEVGILVQPGTTLVLPGPTECFVCKLDVNAGRLEVAVAAPPDMFGWLRSAGEAGSGGQRVVSVLARGAQALKDPCDGKVRTPGG